MALSAGAALIAFDPSGFSAVLAGINIIIYGSLVGWAIGRKLGSRAIARDARWASVIMGCAGALGSLAASHSQATVTLPDHVVVPASLLFGVVVINVAPLYAYVRWLMVRHRDSSV
jgi:hypothetical protein